MTRNLFLTDRPSRNARKARLGRTPGCLERLTPRQREILVLLARGSYYKEIGAELGISPATVRAHLHSVYRKLEVKSRARATALFHECFGSTAS
jgi:RNA polymerase sigma factor (sigma-70 family)